MGGQHFDPIGMCVRTRNTSCVHACARTCPVCACMHARGVYVRVRVSMRGMAVSVRRQ